MPELITPTDTLRDAWLQSRDDWGRGVHQDGSGLRPDSDVDSTAGFAAWVAALRAETLAHEPTLEGRVPCSYWWLVEQGQVLGAIALRRQLNAFLREVGGHIGYGIRPSARRRGLATWALGQVLQEATRLGLGRVLLTCEVDNVASRRTIERHGGVLEDLRDTEIGRLRRYWINLPTQRVRRS